MCFTTLIYLCLCNSTQGTLLNCILILESRNEIVNYLRMVKADYTHILLGRIAKKAEQETFSLLRSRTLCYTKKCLRRLSTLLICVYIM